ncbi:hypothetical protein MUK42_37219, partial [Musa troglodytarum]
MISDHFHPWKINLTYQIFTRKCRLWLMLSLKWLKEMLQMFSARQWKNTVENEFNCHQDLGLRRQFTVTFPFLSSHVAWLIVGDCLPHSPPSHHCHRLLLWTLSF